MSDKYIYNPLNPMNLLPLDIYADSGVEPPAGDYLPLKGGTMQGPINMGSQPVMNAQDPTNPQDLTTKTYVDAADTTIQDDLDVFKVAIRDEVALLEGNVQYAGNYDASTNLVTAVSPYGATILTVGQALPIASAALERAFVIITVNGTGTAPAPSQTLAAGDWILCTGSSWTIVARGSTVVTASQVAFTPGSLSALNVQDAISELDTEKLPLTGGTLTGQLTVPNLEVDGNASVQGSLEIGQQGVSLSDGTGADSGKFVLNVPNTTELIVKGPFIVNDIDYSKPLPSTDISFDNTSSGLEASDIQTAIDIIAKDVSDVATNIITSQVDIEELKIKTESSATSIATIETEVVTIEQDITGLQIETTALNSAVTNTANTVADIKATYLPLAGGNIAGSLQISGEATISETLSLGSDTFPYNISKPNGTSLNITGPTGGTIIVSNPIAYSNDVGDPMTTKGYVDDNIADLNSRISLLEGQVEFVGTYDASTNLVDSVAPAGTGTYTVGQALPASAASNERDYLIVSKSGTGTGPAPQVPLEGGDWVLSSASTWNRIDTSDDIYLRLLGGTMQGSLNMGNNQLTGLKDPVSTTDATTKGYVDDTVGDLGQSLEDFIDSSLSYLGTYDASTNKIDFVTPLATGFGLIIGSSLPTAAAAYDNTYFRVSVDGTGVAPAPTATMKKDSWIYCNSSSWLYYPMLSSGGSGTVAASDVSYTSTLFPSVSNVGEALDSAGTTLNTLGTDVTSLDGKVTTLETDVTDLGTNVTDLESTVTALGTSVTDLESDFTGLETTITGLGTSVASIETDVAALETKVTTTTTDLNALEADFTSYDKSVATGLGTLNLTNNTLATVTPWATESLGLVVGAGLPSATEVPNYYVLVGADGTGVAPLPTVTMKKDDWVFSNGTSWLYYPMVAGGGSGSVTATDVSYTSTEFPSVGNVGEALDFAGTKFGTLDTTITGIETNVTDITNNVTNLTTNVSTLETNVTNVTNNVTNLTTEVNTLETSVTNVTNEVTNLETNVTNLTTEVQTLETNVTNITTNVTNIENNVTNLENEFINYDKSAAINLGTIDLTTNKFTAVTPWAAESLGLAIGSDIPVAQDIPNYYVLISADGTGSAPLPVVSMKKDDWVFSNGTSWLYYPMTGGSGGGGGGDYLPLTGGTLTGPVEMVDSLGAVALTVKVDGGSGSTPQWASINSAGITGKAEIPGGTYGDFELSLDRFKFTGGSTADSGTPAYIIYKNVQFATISKINATDLYYDACSYRVVPTTHFVEKEPIFPNLTPKVRLWASFDAPNANSSLNPAGRADGCYWRWSNLTLQVKIPVNATTTSIPTGLYILCNYDAFSDNGGFAPAQYYVDYINTLEPSYYKGVFGTVTTATEPVSEGGTSHNVKVIGKGEFYDTSNLSTAIEFGDLVAVETPSIKYGAAIGLWVKTAVTVTANKTYYAVIKLPDSVEAI